MSVFVLSLLSLISFSIIMLWIMSNSPPMILSFLCPRIDSSLCIIIKISQRSFSLSFHFPIIFLSPLIILSVNIFSVTTERLSVRVAVRTMIDVCSYMILESYQIVLWWKLDWERVKKIYVRIHYFGLRCLDVKLLEGLTVAIVSTSTYKYTLIVHCMPLILLHSSIFVIIIVLWILLFMSWIWR